MERRAQRWVYRVAGLGMLGWFAKNNPEALSATWAVVALVLLGFGELVLSLLRSTQDGKEAAKRKLDELKDRETKVDPPANKRMALTWKGRIA